MRGACSLRSWISALRDCWMRAVMPADERPNALGFWPLTLVLPLRVSFFFCFLSALVPAWRARCCFFFFSGGMAW